MSEKIDYAELRRTIRDIHDYIRHPEREDYETAVTVAMMSLPPALLLAEQLVRERELRRKAEWKVVNS